ncbi:phosphoinositide 3-kinase regulatory subunit 4 [Microdochium trichocladiopsis]|uniref:non-specific serine/threonine protein kinase n=1 Tax=Microdochium trichocladiopsis TaxID=1682393 RepID=A0A9P8Y760_9PEZI|nr:phosphoinositide 3-kinase regulatory subunit 4 [Microdochium trichocladiopsis]KAH7031153.1 phosphoinositide 3-kinase regulatory subunit 4 [Microdochium trichocladiopsis]
MGNTWSITAPSAGSAGIDVPELADLVYERTIGGARFMKSIRARHHDGVVVVKVTAKPAAKLSLQSYGELILRERALLRDVPNALGFEQAFETDETAYLVRQYLYSSLYDRMSTRPFLEDIEKKWLAFQLLCALRDCHAKEIYHGDIKTENIMVTSWNWLYLTDFTGSFKPAKLPDDNPGMYSYFFDLSGRRTGYIAPERFVHPDDAKAGGGSLTWSMDIFSAGCVIAELFLETPIFSLSQLFKYRRGEYDPAISLLGRIPDNDLREMLSSMIQLDPEKRYSAEQYLHFYKDRIFPAYFYSFLHQYMELITDPSSGRAPISNATKNLGEADDRIDRIFFDFDKITYFLGYHGANSAQEAQRFAPRLGLGLFPVRLSIPNNENLVTRPGQPLADDGALIFLTLVAGSLRSTARATSRIRACDVLLGFAERLTDEAKLDRVLPYLIALLGDSVDLVNIAALRSITQLLALVTVVAPVNAHVFTEYIMPRIQNFMFGPTRQAGAALERKEPSPLVRATYASCLGSLATTALRFLELAVILKAEGTMRSEDPELEAGQDAEALDDLFDNARAELNLTFEAHTKALVEDPDASVRRAFLSSVPELCMFFGNAQSNDILLTHLNTYLNDRDWMLKCAYFDTILGIAPFLGSTGLEEFSLPLMVQAVTDPEEHVVQAALHSLAELAKLGMLSKAKTWELVDVVGRFTMHPNLWIREAASEYLSSATRLLSPADIRCIVLPLVKPFLKGAIIPSFDELTLLDTLKKPMSRTVFDLALSWAQKTDKGLFWKSVRQQKQSTFTIASTALSVKSSREPQPRTLSKVPKNDEDEKWLVRLRNMGMTQEDEFKLLVLREFIWRLSQMKNRDLNTQEASTVPLNEIIPLRSLDVKMQTVMFDETAMDGEPSWAPDSASDADKGPYTIADALLDASMTIDQPVGRRRRAAMNSHRSRLSTSGGAASPTVGDHRALSPLGLQSTSSIDARGGNVAGLRASSTTRSQDDDASVSDAPYSTRRAIRPQSSALHLLNRKDSGRSGPETGTTQTNAMGQVEGPFTQAPAPRITIPGDDVSEGRSSSRLRLAHTYEGNDPSITKMLDYMYIDNFPHDEKEFGPMVTPVSRKKTAKTGTGAEEIWRPSGRLVATFAEHVGAINRVVPSPDHQFFLTGGNDGCVKVWDSLRLERNVTHRARQTHKHSPGAKVTALCFIENTHTFISCATDGRVHIVKVYTQVINGALKYIRLRLLREYQLPANEHAVWCEHFKIEMSSVLILATNRSRVLGIDLRTMTLLYALENPVHHGTPTCFVVDRKRNWLLLGTAHGVLDLWDLRFKMRLKSWGLPGKSPIHRLSLHPTKGRGRWVCVAGGTGLAEVTVWDLEKTQCREIYRAGGKDGPKEYKPWDVDEDRPEGMLGWFATSVEPTTHSSTTTTATGANVVSDRGIRAMVVGCGAVEDQRDVRYGYIVTGGADKKLRFWDLSRIENSSVFSGLNNVAGPDIGATSTTSARPVFVTTSNPGGSSGCVLHVEKLPPSASTSGAGGDRKHGHHHHHGGSARGTSGGSSREKPPRHSVISAEQAQLLRSHLDAIQDVAVLEVPYTMTVSVDRSGVIFVLQ